MNGFVKRVRYPLALLGGGTNPAKGSSFDGPQLGVQVQI